MWAVEGGGEWVEDGGEGEGQGGGRFVMWMAFLEFCFVYSRVSLV